MSNVWIRNAAEPVRDWWDMGSEYLEPFVGYLSLAAHDDNSMHGRWIVERIDAHIDKNGQPIATVWVRRPDDRSAS